MSLETTSTTITPSTSSSTTQKKRTPDGGFIAPDRTARAQCWTARDNFFACLDRHGIVDSVDKEKDRAELECKESLRGFERDCVGTWVKYFKEKRVMEFQRNQTIAKIDAENAKLDARHEKEKEKEGEGKRSLWGR